MMGKLVEFQVGWNLSPSLQWLAQPIDSKPKRLEKVGTLSSDLGYESRRWNQWLHFHGALP